MESMINIVARMKYQKIAYVCMLLLCLACKNIVELDSALTKIDAVFAPVEIEHDGTQTKSTFNKSFNFIWTVDDKIGVSSVGKSTFTSFIIQNGCEGKTSATFVGSLPNGATIGTSMVYPYNPATTISETVLNLNMPTNYDYTEYDTESFGEINNGEVNSFCVPMYSDYSGGILTFKQLGGCFVFEISNIPAGACQFEFKVKSTVKITGNFTVDISAEDPQYTVEKARGANVVTIDFWPSEDVSKHVFCIPVPVGSYEYEWFIYNEDGLRLGYGSSEGVKEISRNKVRVALRSCASISTDDVKTPTIGGWAEARDEGGLAE